MGVWELFKTPGRDQAESAAAWTLTAQKGVDFTLTAVSTKAASPEHVALVFRWADAGVGGSMRPTSSMQDTWCTCSDVTVPGKQKGHTQPACGMRLGRQQWAAALAMTCAAAMRLGHSVAQLSQCPVPCRPATSDSIDQHMPQIGIPGFVQSGSAESTQIYFAFVKKRPKQVQPIEEGPFGADR